MAGGTRHPEDHHARASDINSIPILLSKCDQVLNACEASTLTSFGEALRIDVEAPAAGTVLPCRRDNDAPIAAFQIVEGIAGAEMSQLQQLTGYRVGPVRVTSLALTL
jgi:hypothetical protein